MITQIQVFTDHLQKKVYFIDPLTANKQIYRLNLFFCDLDFSMKKKPNASLFRVSIITVTMFKRNYTALA